MNEYIIAILLGIVEGLTEFLPISSTGHLILVSRFIGFTGDFSNKFNIIIQLGAILAVIINYRHLLFYRRFEEKGSTNTTYDIWKKVIIAFIPAALLGFLFGEYVETILFRPLIVALALISGGVALIIVEEYCNKKDQSTTIATLKNQEAFKIGLFQCLALIPGMSRSASTIIGGLLVGASRKVAAEFSFLLAIPTIAGASLYIIVKSGLAFTTHETKLIIIGFLTSFGVAYLVISGFIKYISRNDFRNFGYYRIILGLVVLLLEII